MFEESIPVFSAKYKIPSPREDYIPRLKLQEKIGALEIHKVTIVKAGAGSGKTTLMSVYIREKNPGQVHWVTMDSSMNQILVFWNYIFHALDKEIKSGSENLKNSFTGTMQRDLLEQMVSLFADRITEEHEVYLVLDDFQNIIDGDLLGILDHFLEMVPATFHLILLSRSMPDLNMGTLYMNGDLCLIDEEDMRISREECEQFLMQTLKVKDSCAAEKIAEEADGWIGGAQLMAIAGKEKLPQAATFTSADQKIIFDYMEKQIFEVLSDEEKLFLEKTSVLSYFNERVCGKYLPEYQFSHMMKQIMEKNLFVVHMDDEKQEYRYHAILREYLLHRLERNISRKEMLFHRAAEIMFEIQDYGECIRLLQEIGDYVCMMEILLKMPQDVETFGYMMQVPMEEIVKNANFAYQYFFCHYASLELDKCGKIYQCIKENLKDDETFQGFKHADLFFDINWEFTGVHIMSLEQIEKMPLNEITKAYLLIKEAYFLFLADEIPEAFSYLDLAEEIYKKTGNKYIEIFVLMEKSQMLEEYGEFNKLIPMYREMKEMLSEVPSMRTSYEIGIAGVYIRQMRLEEAKTALDHVSAEERSKKMKSVQSAYLYTLAEWYYVSGEPEKTWEIYQNLSQDKLYQSVFFSARILRYPIYRGKDKRLSEYFFQNYEKAPEQMKSMDTDLLYAGIVYETGNPGMALALLDQLFGRARKVQNKLKIVECALMKARFVYQQNQDAKKAEVLLMEALGYALPENIRVPFWFEKEFLMGFAEDESKFFDRELTGEQRAFIKSCILVKTVDGEEKADESQLTDREAEVLAEIAEGYSNKETADRLCISLATVKTHLINIYSKLGVNNRIAAVNKYRKNEMEEEAAGRNKKEL